MPFWNKGGESDEAVDDFDEYDPTPYGGGYDLQLTYGRPIPPSEDTCYPVSASAGVDYDRPSYSSGSKPSAYEPEIESDYGSGDRYGHSRPKPQPAYGFHPQEESRPKPNLYGGGGEDDYGSGYSQPKPDYGSGGVGGGYGSGYSQTKPDYGSSGGVGGGYGSEYSQPKPEYGSGGGDDPKLYQSPTGLPKKIPACKRHCLVTCGKVVLLIGGETDPPCQRVSVLSFDIETECWSHVEAKGDIPAARSGHTVIRAGTLLIVFGGEDAKGRKLNDLHMFDLKSLTWLPLHYTGTGPSPRSNHIAALYDDRILLVFGGQSKSRTLNDLYSLDFETMVWARIKIRGHRPSPRADCYGAFCGTKWYIVGGRSKKKRHAETLIFDVSKYEWSVYVTSPNATITTNEGFSLATVHQKQKMFLVAFGGNRKESLNQIETLVVENEHSMNWRSSPDTDSLVSKDRRASTKELAAHIYGAPPCSVAKRSLASALEQRISGRKSVSDIHADMNPLSGSVSLLKKFHDEEDYNSTLRMQKSLEYGKNKESNDLLILSNSLSQGMGQRSEQQETTIQMDIAGVPASAEESRFVDSDCSNIHQKQRNDNSSDSCLVSEESDRRSVLQTNPSNTCRQHETKISTLLRKNVLLEEQLTAAMASREATEKNLSSVTSIRNEMERKFVHTGKEVGQLKEKLASVELAHEEANSLSNIVHSDNVRLEHDLAFLKAVLDDTKKELHSTRGVLAGEKARAFQLQVEVFHLKQRLQSLESRAPTPRKPYHI